MRAWRTSRFYNFFKNIEEEVKVCRSAEHSDVVVHCCTSSAEMRVGIAPSELSHCTIQVPDDDDEVGISPAP